MYVNLGIGIPDELPTFLPIGKDIEIHSENGVIGISDYPLKG